MAFLFQVTDRAVFPNAETLLISPFKDIWERDNSTTKEVAIQELTYVEFMTSMLKSNPYRQYPEGKKDEVIREAVIRIENWQPDELIVQAMNTIIRLQQEGSTTYNYYISAKKAAEKMQDFFINVDINERNFKNGNPIWKPGDITRALNDTEKVLQNLKALEKKVEEELYENAKIKGDKEISPFADPSSIK